MTAATMRTERPDRTRPHAVIIVRAPVAAGLLTAEGVDRKIGAFRYAEGVDTPAGVLYVTNVNTTIGSTTR